MAEPIDYLVGQLPGSNLTTRALRVLDYVVPGAWGNIHDFNALIEDVTKVRDRRVIDEIHVRAMKLYLSDEESYQTAMRLYQIVDKVDVAVGAVSTVSNLGRDVEWLSFLNKVTPKADTAQIVDAALKLTAEVVAFFLLYDLPRDSFKSFVGGLADYAREELMRLAAWVVFEGVVPLGPNFMRLVVDKLNDLSTDELGENKLFKALKAYIPGDDNGDKLNFIQRAVGSMVRWVNDFIEEKGITQEGVVRRLRSVLDFADKGLDYVAAALDVSTNYFEHTGTQTVARAVIRAAWAQMPQYHHLSGGGSASTGGGSARAEKSATSATDAAAAAAAAAAAMGMITPPTGDEEESSSSGSDEWADDWGEDDSAKKKPAASKKKDTEEWSDDW